MRLWEVDVELDLDSRNTSRLGSARAPRGAHGVDLHRRLLRRGEHELPGLVPDLPDPDAGPCVGLQRPSQ